VRAAHAERLEKGDPGVEAGGEETRQDPRHATARIEEAAFRGTTDGGDAMEGGKEKRGAAPERDGAAGLDVMFT
jgi:hypothetical protein